MQAPPAVSRRRWRSIVSWLSGISRSMPSPMLSHRVDAGADGEKRVAAANDGLVGVVGVQMQAAPAEDQCEDVARRGNTLTGRAANTDGEGLTHKVLSQLKLPELSALVAGPPDLHVRPRNHQAGRIGQTSVDSASYQDTRSAKKIAQQELLLFWVATSIHESMQSRHGPSGIARRRLRSADLGGLATARLAHMAHRHLQDAGVARAACRRRRWRRRPRAAPSCRSS